MPKPDSHPRRARSRFWPALVLAATPLALAFPAAGCCQKNKCAAPPTKINIRDQAGTRLVGAQLVGQGLSITSCASNDDCSFTLRGIGAITANAPGFKPATVEATALTDDCDNAVAATIEITLVPESAAEPSLARTIAGAGCGG